MKDFYYILRTPGNASATEIEAAYQKLARKFADDEDAFMNSHFREISEAYDTLRDDRRRRRYDAALRRSQRRHLAAFRLKYLNIALTLTFLVVTALFAWYVIRSIQGHPKKIAPKPEVQPVAAVPTPVHTRKQHKIATAPKPNSMPTADADVKPPTPIVPPPGEAAKSVPRKNSDSTYTATLHANVTGIVYLHKSADYGSAVLAKLPDATEVRVLQKGAAWYKISCNGQEGYVIKSAVER